MIRREFILLCVVVLIGAFSTPLVAQHYDNDGNLLTIPDDVMEPIVYTLANGLTVILYPDNSQPQVTGMVVVNTGGKDDPADATGLAHYMEHMLFKGTSEIGTTNWDAESQHIERIFVLYDSLALTKDPEERKAIQRRINDESVLANQYAIPNELDKILKEIGSTGINAGTGPDYTVYFNNFPGHEMERWLEVYSHRFMDPVFRSFQAELEVVYEEKNMYSDMFVWNMFETFNKHFFKNHPYGQQSLIGSIEHLKNPSLTAMKKFYEKWYVPSNMALIITGNFDPGETMPWIEERFGRWQEGNAPPKQQWQEDPFAGRELVEVKMSPIKIGLLGFRFPPAGHPDQLILEVVTSLLSNANQTGLLDKLGLDNELMQAVAQSVHYSDYGNGMIVFIPKVVGQSLENAEDLVLQQIEKLRKGEFSDTLLESVKLNMYRELVMAQESSQNLAYRFMESFVHGTPYEDIWIEPARVRAVSRDDVVVIANRYFGENYLAFHSKMGFPKGEKIEKPGYEPVVKTDDATSAYYEMINALPAREPNYDFVNFDLDIQYTRLPQGATFYGVRNPKNDVFSLTIRYGVGEGVMPMLKYASQMMNVSGTKEMTHDQFALNMAMLGCNYSISSDKSYLTVQLTGLEENVLDALNLIGQLVEAPVLDQSKLSILSSGEKAMRKLERSEPDMVADALREFVLYGEQSEFLNRLTMKQIKRLKADTLVAAFLRAQQYTPEIHYVGRMSLQEMSQLFPNLYPLNDKMKPSKAPYHRIPKAPASNQVFLTHKKRALQSKIFFHAALHEYDPTRTPLYSAFNTYFGGDFSGIVMQEVREYRSMAYAAGARLALPPMGGNPVSLIGFIGTQGDKTNEAIDLFVDLTRTMPHKPDRMEMIRKYLLAATATQKPSFRYLSQLYVSWQHRGFDRDPAAVLMEGIGKVNADDIFSYQKEHLANAPLTIMIAGNQKQFDRKALAKHGSVTRIKERKLYSK
jgi:zinc protease